MTKINFADIVNVSPSNRSMSNVVIVVHIGLWYSYGKLGKEFVGKYANDLQRSIEEVNRASPKKDISVIWLSSVATHFYKEDWQVATRCSQSIIEGPVSLNWSAIRDLESDI